MIIYHDDTATDKEVEYIADKITAKYKESNGAEFRAFFRYGTKGVEQILRADIDRRDEYEASAQQAACDYEYDPEAQQAIRDAEELKTRLANMGEMPYGC